MTDNNCCRLLAISTIKSLRRNKTLEDPMLKYDLKGRNLIAEKIYWFTRYKRYKNVSQYQLNSIIYWVESFFYGCNEAKL